MKTVRISNALYGQIERLANAKGINKKRAIDYSIRLATSIEESELQENIERLFSSVRDIPMPARRDIERQIRILSMMNRSLFIMTEMLQEDLKDLRNISMCEPIKK